MYASKNTNFVLASIFIFRKWQNLQTKSGKQNTGQSLRKTKRLTKLTWRRTEYKKSCKNRDKTKKSAIAVSNTQKLHYVRVHNSKQLYVSSVSSDNDFLLVGIFKGVFSDEGKEESVQDAPIATRNLNVNLGDWIVVNYDGQKFPGEVTNITGLCFEVNTMHKSLGAFWKWLQKKHRIFYQKENIIQKLDPPEVAGSHGEFQFKNL